MSYQIASAADVAEYDEPNTRVASRADIEAWIVAHRHGPIRQYSALAADDVPQFAIGQDWCGWFHIFTATEQFLYLQESSESGEVDVLSYGEVVQVSRRSTLSLEKLTDLLTHYLTSEQCPAGKWFDERGQPIESQNKANAFAGRIPTARGKHVCALIEVLQSVAQRDAPREDVLALIAHVADDDLAAYLHAVAFCSSLHHVRLHDWWPKIPTISGNVIQLGTLAGGEPVQYENGKIVVIDEEGHRETYSRLQVFLEEWWNRAQEDEQTTSLDAFLNK